MKMKIEILVLMILLVSNAFALTGTRSLVSGTYICENGKYQVVMNPTSSYLMDEILSQNWHFYSLEGDAVTDCLIQSDDKKATCGKIISGTRTLIFNVLNAPGTYNNVFSNYGDNALGLNTN